MELKKLKKELHRLIDKYINDESQSTKLKALIDVDGTPGVRGIFAKINNMGVKIKDEDSDTVKDIFFYYG